MKKENRYIKPFLSFYLKHSIKDNDYVELEETNQGKTPDYYIPEFNGLVEVKEIRDRQEIERNAQWSKIVTKLQKAVDEHPLIKKVKGVYLIDTPNTFKTPTEKEKFAEMANEIVQAAIKNQVKINISNYGFVLNKVENEGSYIVFGTSGPGGSFDPAKTIFENIHDKINTANSQLEYKYKNRLQKKKIVLLVNKYDLLFWNWDLYKGISYIYEELVNYENIDEIWYQNELKDKSFDHKLLFRKAFFKQFELEKFEKYNQADLNLFADWFSALNNKGDEKKNKLFKALKVFLSKKEPHKIFKEEQPREDMVRFGIWLIEKERFEDAIWLINKFINDPNPEKGDKRDEGRMSLHESIVKKSNSREPNIITTVMGHLAWTVQKLALNEKYIVNAFDFTQEVLNRTKNYYVVLEWLIPLIAISGRSVWLKRQSNSKFKDFMELSFSMLDKYSEYPALTRALVHLFNNIRELTTSEAELVLSKLEHAEEVENLIIYFALFRERHFKSEEYPKSIRDYNSKPIKRILLQKIKDTSNANKDTRAGIAWLIWKILAENEKEFSTFSPLIDEYLKMPYENRLFHNFERIIEEWFEREPKKCLEWYKLILEQIVNNLSDNPNKGRDIWLTVDTDKILSKIAVYSPEDIIPILEKLTKIWWSGAFIGEINEVFNSYKHIKNNSLKEEVKDVSKKLYKDMKKSNPKIQEVNFD